MNGRRPDVQKLFPQYSIRGGLTAWTTYVDFEGKLGNSEIRAEALDGRGALTLIDHVTVRIVP